MCKNPFTLLERTDAALCGIGIPALGGTILPNHWLGGWSGSDASVSLATGPDPAAVRLPTSCNAGRRPSRAGREVMAMAPTNRRFSTFDALVMVAATAVGLAVVRSIEALSFSQGRRTMNC